MNWGDSVLYNIRYKKFIADSSATGRGTSFVVHKLEDEELTNENGIQRTFETLLNGEVHVYVGVRSDFATSTTKKVNYIVSILDDNDDVIVSEKLETQGSSTMDRTDNLSVNISVKSLHKYTIKVVTENPSDYVYGVVTTMYINGYIVDDVERYLF